MNKKQAQEIVDRLAALAGSQAELARRLNQTPQNIRNWRNRGIPTVHVDAIEREFDFAVLKHEMRPDAFAEPTSAA